MDEDPRIGQVLEGRYRVDSPIGGGGAGMVYRGVQLGLERPVAIKFLHQSRADSEQHRARFRREATAMSRLGHPNVASIIDFGSDDGTSYLVMELYDGTTLRELIDEAALDLPRALSIARQILAGLGSAHEAGVVHRDLKPGNVLLMSSMGEDHVKILDFGVAKLLSGDSPTEVSVAVGNPLGTPHYMSPEQATASPIDRRTDLYSVGVMLYEMTTGARPFEAGIGFAILRKQIEDAPPSPRERREDMSPELEAVILRAMQKEPADRFQSARDMMLALAAVPELQAAARSNRKRAWVRRALLASVACAALGGSWWAAEQGLVDVPFLESDTSAGDRRPLGGPAPRRAPSPSAASAAPRPARPVPAPPPPAWSPPDAEVVLASPPALPSLDNGALTLTIGGEAVTVGFARFARGEDVTALSFFAEPPAADPCPEADDARVDEALLHLELAPLGRRRKARGRSRVAVRDGDRSRTPRARWRVELLDTSDDSGIVTGRLRVTGKKVAARGRFAAALCPSPAAPIADAALAASGRAPEDDGEGEGEGDGNGTEPAGSEGSAAVETSEGAASADPGAAGRGPIVNGLPWLPHEPPAASALPERRAAAALGDRRLEVGYANLVASDEPGAPGVWMLSLFEERPADPCRSLAADEPGLRVALAPEPLADLAISTLLDVPDATDSSASADAPWADIEGRPASSLALRIDDVSDGAIRGRVYVAVDDRARSVATGAFEARDCRATPSE